MKPKQVFSESVREDTSIKPVQRRLLVPLAVVLLLLVGGFSLVLVSTYKNNLDQSSEQVLEDASDELANAVVEQSEGLAALEEVFLRDAGLRDALKDRDRERLLAAYGDVFAQLRQDHGITHFHFHRPDRVNLLRVHKPEKHGDLIDRFTAREAERTGKTASGIELGPLGTFTLRVVRPVFDGGTVIGYLELGKEIEDILAGIHGKHGVELAVDIHKSALDRAKWEAGMKMLGREADWDRFPDDVLIYTSMPRFLSECEQYVGEAGHRHDDVTAEAEFDGKSWRVMTSPLEDVSGAEVGGLIVMNDISETKAAFNRLIAVVSGAVLVLLTALIGFLYVVLRRTDQGIWKQLEDLRKSEAFQRTLSEALPDFIFILDADGVIQRVNRVQPGHREEDVVGQRALMFIPPGYHAAFEEAFRQALDTERVKTVETEVDFPDGRHYFLNRLNPVSFAGMESSVILIATDITDRKRAEEQLRESEEKFRSIFESFQDLYFKSDIKGNFKTISPSVKPLAGYEEDELIGKSVLEVFVDAVDRDELMEALLAAGKINNYELKLKKKSGQVVTVSLNAQIVKDGSGHPTAVEGVMRDITKQKRAEEAVRQAKERTERILNSVQSGVLVVDVETHEIVEVNPAAAAMIGAAPEEIVGRVCHQFICPGEKGACPITDKGQSVDNSERVLLTKDGGRASILKTVAPVTLEGRECLLETFVDISDRKRAEEELRQMNEHLERQTAIASEMAAQAEMANKTKSEFLANMSHEIRTPMNSVIGFIDMLFDTDLNEEQIDYATTAKRSGEALLSLINDVLDFSKIEAGELDFEEIDFDPELLAHDICAVTRPRIGLKPIEILCRIGDNLPSYVRGDPGRFRQVLTNFMGNASKFTDSGEIELSLDIEEEKDDRVMLHATIRDTGIGLPKDKLATIFESFKQVDASTTRRYGGTGLGLSICKKISELMGGDVWAESEPKKGSIFHFTAWLGKAEEKEAKRFTPVSLSGKKALIVDDNQRNLDILTHVLESAGMDVNALRNGEEVIPTLQKALEAKDFFDLAIIDIQMPGMSGYEVAKAIRDSKSLIPTLPMIALSSLIEREAKRCKEAGFDGFLSKPIRREKLFQMMESLLGEIKEGGEEEEAPRQKMITQYSIREDIKHSVRILLAEDNPVNQKLAKLMLTKAGYHVEVANNGKEAVEKFTSNPDNFDLIFMDIQMPEMDGMEATEIIRKKGFDTIPIVAITAHAMKGDRENCLKAGMDDYITKPIKRETVFKVIEKWVLKKEA